MDIQKLETTVAELQKKVLEMQERLADLELKKMNISLDTSIPGEVSIIRNTNLEDD